MSSRVLTASHPKLGTLWASVDPSVHHIEGAVGDSRFAARLAPFRSEADAKAALAQAGAVLESQHG